MELIDNVNKTLKDDLTVSIQKDSKVSIAAACFSIYAFQELKRELKNVDELRFIFTSPTFIKEKAKKEKREFYIPRQTRERSLYGSEFEVKLRNEMTQRAIAKECAEWIRKKATFKSNVTSENMMGFMNVDSNSYMPINGFTTIDLGCERGNNAYYPIQKTDTPMSQFYLDLFEQIWNDEARLQEVTDEVIDSITTVYTVDFDSNELIKKAIEQIDRELFVSQLQYTVSKSEQRDVMDAMMVRESNSFYEAKSSTTTLKHSETSQIKYDLIGKIAEGTVLTRKTVAAILQGISPIKFAMFKNNPEEFITKVIRLIKEQKATMIVEHISYDQIEGKYDSTIFTAEKHASFDKAYRAEKHIQDYVFTDGTAEKSVERKFAEELDGAKEVCVYAKLPKGFAIPTPVGSYSPDWAIAFYEGTVKHIYFIAETKGTMESLELRPIEKAKISCARKLFNEISTENVVYHDVDSYQSLLNIMNSIEK